MPSRSRRQRFVPLHEFEAAQASRAPCDSVTPSITQDPAPAPVAIRTSTVVTPTRSFASVVMGTSPVSSEPVQETSPNGNDFPAARSRTTSGETQRSQDTQITIPTAEPSSPKEQPAVISSAPVEQQAPAPVSASPTEQSRDIATTPVQQQTPTPPAAPAYTMHFGALSFECGDSRRSRMLDTHPVEQQEDSNSIYNDIAVLCTGFKSGYKTPINGVREGNYTKIMFGKDRFVLVRDGTPQPPLSSTHPATEVEPVTDMNRLNAMLATSASELEARSRPSTTVDEPERTPAETAVSVAATPQEDAPVGLAASRWAPLPEAVPVDKSSSPIESTPVAESTGAETYTTHGLAASKWAPQTEPETVADSRSAGAEPPVERVTSEHATSEHAPPPLLDQISVADAFDVVAVDPVPASDNVDEHSGTKSTVEVASTPLVKTISLEERISVDADDTAFADDSPEFEDLTPAQGAVEENNSKSFDAEVVEDGVTHDDVPEFDSTDNAVDDRRDLAENRQEDDFSVSRKPLDLSDVAIAEPATTSEDLAVPSSTSKTPIANAQGPVPMPSMTSVFGRGIKWADIDDEDDEQWWLEMQAKKALGGNVLQTFQALVNDTEETFLTDEQLEEPLLDNETSDEEAFDEDASEQVFFGEEFFCEEAVEELEQETSSQEAEEESDEEIIRQLVRPDENGNIPISSFQVLGCSRPPLQQSDRGQCIEYYGNASIEFFDPESLYEDRIKKLCHLAGRSEDERMEAVDLLMYVRELQLFKQQFWMGRQAIFMDYLSGIPDTDEDPNFSLREYALAKAEMLIPASLRPQDPVDMTLREYIWAVMFPTVCADFVSIGLNRDPHGDWYEMEEVSRDMEISAPGIAGTPFYYCFAALLEYKDLRTEIVITDVNRRFCLMRNTILNLRPVVARMESDPQWQVVMKEMAADTTGKFCKQPVITSNEKAEQLLEQGMRFRRGYGSSIKKGMVSRTLQNLNIDYPDGRTSAVIHKAFGKSPLSPAGIELVAGNKFGSSICLRDGQTMDPRLTNLSLISVSTEDADMKTDSEPSSTPQLSTSASDDSLPFFAMDDFPEPAEGDHGEILGDDVLSDEDPFMFDASSDHEEASEIDDTTDVVQLSPAVTILRPGQLRRKQASSQLAADYQADSPPVDYSLLDRGHCRQLRVFSGKELRPEDQVEHFTVRIPTAPLGYARSCLNRMRLSEVIEDIVESEDYMDIPSSPPLPAPPVQPLEVSTPVRHASFFTNTLPELSEDSQHEAEGSGFDDLYDLSDDTGYSSPFVDAPEHLPLDHFEAKPIERTLCFRPKPHAESDATIPPVDSWYESPVHNPIDAVTDAFAAENIHGRDFAREVSHTSIKDALDTLINDLTPIRPVLDDAEVDGAVSVPHFDEEHEHEGHVSVPASSVRSPVFSIFSDDSEDGIMDFLFVKDTEDTQKPEVTDNTASIEQNTFTPFLFGDFLDFEEREEPVAFLFAGLLEENVLEDVAMEAVEFVHTPVVVINTDDLVSEQLSRDLMATLEGYAAEIDTLPSVDTASIQTIQEPYTNLTGTGGNSAPILELGPFVPGTWANGDRLAVLDLPADGKFGGMVYLAGLAFVFAYLW